MSRVAPSARRAPHWQAVAPPCRPLADPVVPPLGAAVVPPLTGFSAVLAAWWLDWLAGGRPQPVLVLVLQWCCPIGQAW
ncbi:hypothetical protein ACLQ22_08505 [Micromonospora sp. DT178]|uniref:hypothetical protein n=1 Tax=Micromonospora sp. DT178 TaxID=3393436 RepID=UPI003CEF9F93